MHILITPVTALPPYSGTCTYQPSSLVTGTSATPDGTTEYNQHALEHMKPSNGSKAMGLPYAMGPSCPQERIQWAMHQ